MQSAMLILRRCKECAEALKDIFEKTIPSKDASRSERYKKAVGIKLKSNKVKEYMEEVIKSMELLAQNQVFQDAEALKDLQDAIEQLDNVPDTDPKPQYVQYGDGPLIAHSGTGNVESHSHSGSGHIYTAKSQTFQTNPGTSSK
jgi:excinuclease UvrABC nuclease subunit